jgi:hypothetical protein
LLHVCTSSHYNPKSDKSSNYTSFLIGFKERVREFVVKIDERRKKKSHNLDEQLDYLADDLNYESDDEQNRFDNQHIQDSPEKPERPMENRGV